MIHSNDITITISNIYTDWNKIRMHRYSRSRISLVNIEINQTTSKKNNNIPKHSQTYNNNDNTSYFKTKIWIKKFKIKSKKNQVKSQLIYQIHKQKFNLKI